MRPLGAQYAAWGIWGPYEARALWTPLTPLRSFPPPPPRSFPSNYWDKFVKRKVMEGSCSNLAL